ncbi:HpcH/HpaI aldolase/citrate lyase family protein [Thermodesulfobacteriota bacterium]
MKLGMSINLDEPAIVEIAAWLGYDFVWIDCEHSNFSNLSELIRAAEIGGMEAWVRVPSNEPSVISAVLNIGAKGIIIPHVKRVSDAENAVKNTKFFPVGLRSWFSKGRDARYGIDKVKTYINKRNAEVRLIVQIEDPEGIKNARKIISVSGVDMAMTGPGDLAHCLGIPGKINDIEIMNAEDVVFKEAERAKKPVLHFAFSSEELRPLIQKYSVEYLVIASDVSAVISTLKSSINEIKKTLKNAGRNKSG